MYTLKLTKIGNSVGVILPKEILAILNVGQGDTLSATQIKDGFAIRPHTPDFEEWMNIGDKIMRENRAVLRKLAE